MLLRNKFYAFHTHECRWWVHLSNRFAMIGDCGLTVCERARHTKSTQVQACPAMNICNGEKKTIRPMRNQMRAQKQKKRKVIEAHRMKMNCVLGRLVGRINDMCVCAFTARSLRITKNLLGFESDLWLWYRFELHSKHNSTFSYYIVHFLCHSDRYFCHSFFNQSQSLSFSLVSLRSSSRLIVVRFFKPLRSTFRFFGHSSSSSLFDSILSVCSRFFFSLSSLVFFCLKTAHKLFCECEPNEMKRKKENTLQQQQHSTWWRWKRRRWSEKRMPTDRWLCVYARPKEEESSQNKFKNITSLERLSTVWIFR